MSNLVFQLTESQTSELREIWNMQKRTIKPEDFLFIKVKLGRSQAVLTNKQLFRMTMTMAESGYEKIPEWLLTLIDPIGVEA